MWTIDARCAQCAHKPDCKDRPEIIKTLTALQGKLNTEEEYTEGPGDGIMIVSCKDFEI
jgi:hypothetical protein